MRSSLRLAALAALFALALVVGAAFTSRPAGVNGGVGPALQSLGPLTFGANGVLYAADPQAATIYALELEPGSAATGTAGLASVDEKVAAMLGTGASEIAITDLAVDPRTKNSYLAVMRGRGAGAQPALLRVDGSGKLELLSLDDVRYTSVTLPNPADVNPAARTNPRAQSVMDLALHDGKLYVAGLSNEEFASKLWALPYPFTGADRGTSVEIFHGNHGRLETRSPVYSFVPYAVAGEPHLIAGYLCTPLVKFPLKSLAPGAKILGTTIAELGAGNRPIDMIQYRKDGKDFLLMSNTSRGVMKIGTERFAAEAPITAPVPSGTAGVPFETIAALAGVTQLDRLDDARAVVLRRASAQAPVQLETVVLP